MCLEDLKLGRGRKTGQRFTSSGSSPSLMPPNAKRVALIVSFRGGMWFDSGGLVGVLDAADVIAGDNINSLSFLSLSPGCGPIVLRIEDVGQFVCGAFSAIVTNSTGSALLIMTEILSDVEAEAITR